MTTDYSIIEINSDGLLAPYSHTRLKTRTGFEFYVRSACPADAEDLEELLGNVSDDDRRFRFLTAVKKIPPQTLSRMTTVDHENTEDFFAFHDGKMIATAMIATSTNGPAADRSRAEVAIAIHSNFRGMGIGWVMLEYAVAWAKAKGIAVVESIESYESHDAIQLQREMGFTSHPYPGDASLVVIEKHLG
jgi:GNAT superfamily N-acetyltransferase